MELLGEGSQGKVFRAEDVEFRRHVALKCLKRSAGSAAGGDEAFLEQMRSVAPLDHPGLVRVVETGVAEGFRYIAMELIEGGTLAALIKGCGSLDVARASQLCAEAAETLAYAAEQEKAHGNVKPENLLLTRAGRCRIADFGFPRQEQAPPLKGPSPYAAPEVLGGLSPTEKSDVYSLTAVYYFLLTGRPPGAASDQPGAAGPDVRALNGDLPADVAAIIARGMAKNPDDRPLMVELALQLRAQTIAMGDSQVLSISGPASPPEPAPYVPAANRWELLSLLIGTAAVVLVVLLAWLVLRRPQKQNVMPMLDLLPPLSQRVHPASSQPAEEAGTDMTDLATAIAKAPRPLGAGNRQALDQAAREHAEVEVTGTVSAFQYNPAQHIVLLLFAENPKFTVAYREPLARDMSKKFGGERGNGVVGKKVRVRGKAELIMNVATVLIENQQAINAAP
ncbi:MAG: serine/threonine-protein kinase [Phycisphaerae bacterium]